MRKNSLLGFVVALSLAVVSAHAETIVVNSDAGTLGTFKLTNNGQVDGVWSYTLQLQPVFEQALLSINGVNVGQQQAIFGASIAFTVTGGVSGLTYQLASDDYTKIFSSPVVDGLDASLVYTLHAGSTGDAAMPGTPGLNDVLNLAGTILGVGQTGAILDLTSNQYDFSSMVGGDIVLSLTGQTYTGISGTQSMGAAMRTPGATVMGGVAEFSQGGPAVPEPTSVALLGIGLGGLLAYRRRLAKRTTA